MKSNWGKVGHLFSHAAIICRLSIFIPVGLFLRVTWFIWPTYRLVAGQRRLRGRLEFYFDGNFLGGRAALESAEQSSLTDGDEEPQFSWVFFCSILTFGHMIWFFFFSSTDWSMHFATKTNMMSHVRGTFLEDTTVIYLFLLASSSLHLRQ